MIALVRFRLAAYTRSHRAVQPLIGLLPLLAILYAAPVPPGAELGAAADSAAILVPVFAWAARGLLDSEPDEQRMISRTAAGRSEVAGGLLAAGAYDLVLAAVAMTALVLRLSAAPGAAVLAAGACLHLLSVIAGVALGALTSRPIIASPAVSSMTLILGYLVMLLISMSGTRWLGVPLLTWMRDAHHGVLLAELPLITVQSLLWPALGLAGYARLRLTRP
ncbi:hypothetical protein ACQP1K_21335 [Sphaerimonospora sp. CA-214678]|uniref:hypothetical protein n=1 Tax=Sphaerimonospora sp. CA-214678 TaxID=3240029 RepID=UPI003D8D27D3